MPNDIAPELSISRRTLLKRIMALGLTTGPLALISGCGSELAGSGESPPRSQGFSLLTAEVGGSGHTIVSPFASPAAMTSGSAQTLVSGEKMHLISAVDSSGELRALGVAGSSLLATTAALGAESTALGLLLLCTGITVTETSESVDRIGHIKSLSTFAPLVNRLRALLPTSPVAQAANDPGVQVAMEAVIDQFLSVSLQPLSISGESSRFGIEGRVLKSSPTSAVQLGLIQRQWRSALIVRRDLTPGEVALRSIKYDQYLTGHEPVGLSDLWTGRAVKTWEDPFSTNFDVASEARYFIIGPGYSVLDIRPGTVPPGLSLQDIGRVWTVNVIEYLVLPLLDVLGLGLSFKLIGAASKRASLAIKMLETILDGAEAAQVIHEIQGLSEAIDQHNNHGGSDEDVNDALVKVVIAVLKALVSIASKLKADLVVGGLLIIAAAKVSTLALIISAIYGILGIVNLYAAIQSWKSVPPALTYSFTSTGDGVITIS